MRMRRGSLESPLRYGIRNKQALGELPFLPFAPCLN
jgi:hypothetical protein